MKLIKTTISLFVFVLLLVSPAAYANDYGGQFFGTADDPAYAPIECYFITNLDDFERPVTIKYYGAEAERLGKESAIAEPDKCYALYGSYPRVYPHADATEMIDVVTESADAKQGSFYFTYLDFGVPYGALIGPTEADWSGILSDIQDTVNACDNRVRIETYVEIRVYEDPDDEWVYSYPYKVDEKWLLKDGTTIDVPEINVSEGLELDWHGDGYLVNEEYLVAFAGAIGCSAETILALNERTQKFVEENPIIPPTEEGAVESQPETTEPEVVESPTVQHFDLGADPVEHEKTNMNMGWFLIGLGLLMVVFYFLKREHKK
jgi:hypothetical protein